MNITQKTIGEIGRITNEKISKDILKVLADYDLTIAEMIGALEYSVDLILNRLSIPGDVLKVGVDMIQQP